MSKDGDCARFASTRISAGTPAISSEFSETRSGSPRMRFTKCVRPAQIKARRILAEICECGWPK